MPSIELQLGPAIAVHGVGATTFQLAVDAGVQVGWPGRSGAELLFAPALWLTPRVGYSFRNTLDLTPSGHFLTLGMGIGYGQLLSARVQYVPRFVVGKIGDEHSLGFRHGVAGSFLVGVITIELAHQVDQTPTQLQHQILLSVGLNPGAPIYLYAKHGR